MIRKDKNGNWIKTVRVDTQGFDNGSLCEDGSLWKVIASLGEIADSIPYECRDTARFSIEACEYYLITEAEYDRPATEGEIMNEECRLRNEEQIKVVNELREYERLKQKFGGR